MFLKTITYCTFKTGFVVKGYILKKLALLWEMEDAWYQVWKPKKSKVGQNSTSASVPGAQLVLNGQIIISHLRQITSAC